MRKGILMKIHIKKRALNRSYGGDIPIILFMALAGLFMSIPIIYAVSSSLKPPDEFWVFPPRFFVKNPTSKNFSDLVQIMSSTWVPFSRYIFNTVFITIAGTLGHVIVASLCAFAFAKYKFPGSKAMFTAVELTLMFNTTVTAIPNFIIMSKINFINTYWALIIPAWGSSLGLYLLKQFMEQMIPDSLIEAATIDGANKLVIYRKLVMPIVKPAWLTLIIFSFQGLWSIGSTTYIQNENMKTFNYALSQILAGGIARAGAVAAASVVMMIVPVVVFVASQNKIVETMATSGMKD